MIHLGHDVRGCQKLLLASLIITDDMDERVSSCTYVNHFQQKELNGDHRMMKINWHLC